MSTWPEAILDRIGYSDSTALTIETLSELQHCFLTRVPFENLDIHLGRPIRLERTRVLEKVVNERRGGWCFELNEVFFVLLEALGFEVIRCASTVLQNGGDADELLSAGGSDAGDRREAVPFLQKVLADGPVSSDEVLEAGKANGLSMRTLSRAKRPAGVESTKIGFGKAGKWYWWLAKNANQSPKCATPQELASLEAEAEKSTDFAGADAKDATSPPVAALGADVASLGPGDGPNQPSEAIAPEESKEVADADCDRF